MTFSKNSSTSHTETLQARSVFLLADFNGKIGPRQLDYSRTEGISDHDYVRNLLQQSIEELSDHPELPDDDGSDCAEAIEEYWKHRSSLN